MRILYLGFNVGYINPTRQLLLEALSRIAEVTAFGPGFVSPALVQAGIDSFVKTQLPFDFVVSDEYVLQQFDERHPERIRFVNHACRFDRGLLIKALEYRDFLTRTSIRRVVSLLQTDFYNVSEQFLATLDRVADHVLAWGEELILPRAAATLATATDGVNARILERWHDNYLSFVRRERARVISLPHIIGDDEFCDSRLAGRAKDWTVVGADYTHRLHARAALDAAGLSRSGSYLPRLFALFERARINPYAHYWSIALLQHLFRRALVQARFGFTCGSSARMAIRKFLEIPAAGTVLVADPCAGAAELGFVDRQTFVASAGADVLDAHRWLIADPDRAQSIADAGRRLIAEQHSVTARARQLRGALELILAEDFSGSYWRNGTFILRRRNGDERNVHEESIRQE